MASCIMKQLREKHVSTEIFKCIWSPKMDLLAIANVQGQVILQRLSWQQVWSLSPPKEGVVVTALVWRPDGKILAIGYSSGKTLLVNVEDSSPILSLDLKKSVTSISWPKYCTTPEAKDNPETEILKDPWSSYMSSLPQLGGKSFNESGSQNKPDLWQEPHLLQQQTELNVLCIGVLGCTLHLYAFGLLHIATIDLHQSDPLAEKILSIMPTTTLDTISLILERVEDNRNELCQVTLKSRLLAKRYKQIHYLAQKYGQIHSLSTYISQTINLIEEAWDSALLEMDVKLTEYSESFPEGTVSAEFMELLVFGHTSANFEVFLGNKLTEPSLKKLRQSFDLCYSMMQKLVVKHLQPAAVSLIFLLSQVQGMSRRKELFEELGVDESDVTAAMGTVGSFLLKVSEFLGAIESSMKDFNIFVRWVTNVHLRLHKHVPNEPSKMSQHEVICLLNFLNDSLEEVVTDYDGQKSTHFRLERTGQYLKKEELKTLPHSPSTPFANLLNENPSLTSHPLVFKHNPKSSLVMEHQALVEALSKMANQPGKSIGDSVEIGQCISLSVIDSKSSPAISQAPLNNGNIACAIISSTKYSNEILITEWPSPDANHVKSGLFMVDSSNGPPYDSMTLTDLQFYSSEILSLLLLDPAYPRNPTFAQLSIQEIRSELLNIPHQKRIPVKDLDIPRLSLSLMPDAISIRRLETGLASAIAVSGSRKVAAVLGDNRRRIRIYEMGADEEEDEDEMLDTKDESGFTEASANTDDIDTSF